MDRAAHYALEFHAAHRDVHPVSHPHYYGYTFANCHGVPNRHSHTFVHRHPNLDCIRHPDRLAHCQPLRDADLH